VTKEARERDITINRRAFHDYFIDELFEAGLVLTGSEVKSLRDHRAHLKDAYARFFGDELFLVGAHINPYAPASQFGHDPIRTRKLLLHRREIERLSAAVAEKGFTLVPTRLYFRDGRVKVELALARGKELRDKRRDVADRDARRQIERELKSLRR